MKKVILVLFLTMGTIAMQGQEIKWMTLDEALAKQKKNPKPIFMDVFTDWCGPCKMLDKETFRDPEVVDYITKNYYAVKFNAEGNSALSYKGVSYTNPAYDSNRKGRNSAHDFTKFLQVGGYPSMYIFDKNGEIEESVLGYKTHLELLKILK